MKFLHGEESDEASTYSPTDILMTPSYANTRFAYTYTYTQKHMYMYMYPYTFFYT